MQRQYVLDLLKLSPQQDHTMVYGWFFHELLASIEVSSALLYDNDIRSMLLRHILQAQRFLDGKSERLHLLETRALAIFIANSLSQGLPSLSPLLTSNVPAVPMMDVLLRQRQGVFPFLLMHVDDATIFNFLDSILKCPFKPAELHVIIGSAICNELQFQAPKVLNGNQIWKVEKIGYLLSTFMETIGDEIISIGRAVASYLEPLAHFLLKFSSASYCSEYLFLRLVTLIVSKYSETPQLRRLIPQFLQSISWNIPTLTASLKFEPPSLRVSSESEAKRRVQLQVITLMESLLQYKVEHHEVVERLATHQVVDRIDIFVSNSCKQCTKEIPALHSYCTRDI
jgi:hypothetical protein